MKQMLLVFSENKVPVGRYTGSGVYIPVGVERNDVPTLTANNFRRLTGRGECIGLRKTNSEKSMTHKALC